MRKTARTAITAMFVCVFAGLFFSESAVSSELVEQSGVQGGFISHLGCAEGTLTASLKMSDAYVVHGLDTHDADVRQARRRFLDAGLCGSVNAATFDGLHLPYADDMVNLLIVSSRFNVAPSEMMRVLAPNGVILEQIDGQWLKTVKPISEALDDWSHYLHAPDNNAVSRDTAIAAPLQHLQWEAGPRYARHHDKTSSVPAVVSSGGRVFYIADLGPDASILWDADWNLVARDAFNGVKLWEREIEQWTDQLWALKSGPADTPRRLVALQDAVYVTLGLQSPVSKLDAATGNDVLIYEGTENTEEILVDEGILYLVVNPQIDPTKRGGVWERTPKTVMAVNESDGTILWHQELSWIAPLSLTIGGTKAYVCDGPHIIAMDKVSGEKLWQSQELPWRESMPTYFAPTLVAVGDECLLYAGGENWREHAGSMGLMTCLEADTGEVRWQQPHLPSGYQSPQDIFVIDGTAWCGSLNSKPGEFDTRYPEVAPSTGEFVGYDIKTGKLSRTIPRDADCYWFHHRCHRARATEDYFLTSRTGIEMINVESGRWDLHHWARGACLYGIMPANGLIYCPPHPCACYPEAKLSGFNALSDIQTTLPQKPEDSERTFRAAAYDSFQDGGSSTSENDGWPTYRNNAARSGSSNGTVDVNMNVKWQTSIGNQLSQPVAVGDQLFVAAIEDHAIYALNRETGNLQWRFIAGGRVDSPPTIYRGRVIFGSRDGYVYCLRASNGALVWRFQAAAVDRRIMSYGQLESVWPVHGSVLIQNDIAYVVAGRSMFLNEGLTFYRLNPITGEMLLSQKMDEHAPDTNENLHQYVTGIRNELSMPVASSDILSCEGERIYMRSQPLDLMGNRERVECVPIDQQRGEDTHLFAPNGFLDDNWWHRSFWVYGRSVLGGPRYWETGRNAPSGKIMVLDEENLYLFGRQQKYWRWTTPTEYRLFSIERSMPPANGDNSAKSSPAFAIRWETSLPLLARAMVKADDVVFICGPEDIVPEEEYVTRAQPQQLQKLRDQAAVYSGSEGCILCAVSAADGSNLKEINLDVLPVFDGMIAAYGNIYMSTVDGRVVCLGAMSGSE